MDGAITVLHVDDEPDVLELTASRFERQFEGFEFEGVTDAESCLEALEAREDVDCVVSDYEMPRMDGIELLEAVRERDPDLPFILFTGKGSEEVASEAISAGVTDYLQKSQAAGDYELLANRIENAVRQREARRQYEAERENYRKLVEKSNDAIVVIQDREFKLVNRQFAELMGVADPDEFVGVEFLPYVHPDYRQTVIERYEARLAGEEPPPRYEIEVLPEDGDPVPVELNMSVVTYEDEPADMAVIRDISERKARERDLQRYETIVEASGDAVYTLDPEGRFTYMNEAQLEITGYEEDELLGEPASEVLPADAVERSEALIRELLGSEADRGTIELEVRTADGERIPCEVHIALLPGEDGFGGTVGVVRDIGERKERERRLTHQNERLEDFASVVSHDLRNPLNVAMAHLEAARDAVGEDDGGGGGDRGGQGDGEGGDDRGGGGDDGGDAASVAEHHAEIGDALKRMGSIIDDVLTLAREGAVVDETDMEPVSIADLATRCWGAVDAPEAAIETDDDVTVTADASRLRHVLENCFRNAVEHGGEDVTVTVGALEDGGFYVADDGPGIPEDARERVFESGYSRGGGTGFGLAIVERIVTAHGWSIEVAESAAGGARFEIHTGE